MDFLGIFQQKVSAVWLGDQSMMTNMVKINLNGFCVVSKPSLKTKLLKDSIRDKMQQYIPQIIN